MFGSVPAPDQSGGGGDGDEGYGDLGELLGAMERVDAPGGAPHTIQRSRNSDLALRATSMTQSALRNIIYFCIPATRPVGGINYILRHSLLINTMSDLNVSSYIHMPGNSKSEISWNFPSDYIKRDTVFNRKTDFIVVPEVMVSDWAPTLVRLGVRYAIIAQNGFYVVQGRDNIDVVQNMYNKADFVISTSDETSKYIVSLFPELLPRILTINYAFDRDVFFQTDKKRDVITYMPRKLPYHAQQVIQQLRRRNLKGWQIEPIDGLDEAGVAGLLRSSKIFMSFSEFEGFGLPPVEAALSGNKVIGYTGQGGLEYWTPPLFEEIYCGDILGFAGAVVREIFRQSDTTTSFADSHAQPIAELADRYSAANEAIQLRRFVAAAATAFS